MTSKDLSQSEHSLFRLARPAQLNRKNGKNYIYNTRGQLTGVLTDSKTISYAYDPIGRRSSKTVNGQTSNHYWDGSDIVRETGANNAVYYKGINLIAQQIDGAVGYYLYNAHGDITGITGGKARSVGTFEYDAFGNGHPGNSAETPFRYNGQYYDEETGLYYLRNRYYDSSTGRFTQEDPAMDGLNWYVYCNNDPVNFVDRSGLKPGDIFDTLDEAALDAGGYYVTITIENDEEMCGLFYQNADGKFTYYDVENEADNKTLGFKVSWNWSNDPTKNPIAFIHSHVFHDINNPNNEFSTPGNTTGPGDDVTFAVNNGIPIFVAAPTGEVKKYDPSTNITSFVGNISVDPKYETAQWYQNTLIWNLLDKQYPDINKIDIIKAKVEYSNSLYDMLKVLGIIN